MVSLSKVTESLVETALEAADSALILNTPSQISRASKAWKKCKILGMDTEFVRERTYYAELGLVQISDGQSVWLIDPQVEGSLPVIHELLSDSRITKIFHSPSEDLEVLLKTVGALPQPMLDTQIACALLGQPLQLAYHAMVRWLLDVNLENDQTRSNWIARPLSAAQLRYAALDVCLLPMIWQVLEGRLRDVDRLEWFLEDCELVMSTASEPATNTPAWTRIRGIGKLNGVGLAILVALYEWREKQARARNLPRGFVIKDPVMLNIAHAKPANLQALQEIEGLHPGAIRRYSDSLLDVVHQVQSSGQSLPRIEALSKQERDCLAKMKALVSDKADRLGLEPPVIASRRELETILRLAPEQWPIKFDGWRGDLVRADLEKIASSCGQ